MCTDAKYYISTWYFCLQICKKNIVKNYCSNKMINVGIADPFYYKVAQRAELY